MLSRTTVVVGVRKVFFGGSALPPYGLTNGTGRPSNLEELTPGNGTERACPAMFAPFENGS